MNADTSTQVHRCTGVQAQLISDFGIKMARGKELSDFERGFIVARTG